MGGRESALHAGFLRSARRFPDRPAVEVAGAAVSYRELEARARAIAAVLTADTPEGGAPLTAVFAYRTVTAYAGVLAALFRGHGYVALNRRYPPYRSRVMLENAGARALVVDRDSAGQLDELLEQVREPLLVVLPEHDDVSELARRWPRHAFRGRGDVDAAEPMLPAWVDPDSIAYLIFTSGSTGTPKAVMVRHRNIGRYVELMTERWHVTERDRLSQTFDMTFDLSVNDMFVAWERGACICCIDPLQLVKPSKFITESALTVWYAVPSVGLLMHRLGMLRPGSYPNLRLVLFCGEALPSRLAEAWAAAAPNAVLENVYGPTEVTITCANYTWDPAGSPAECELGLVPIGRFLPGMTPLVLGDDGREVPPGEVGELYLAGPQVTPGYWRDPERTAAAFFVPQGQTELHYKTGDRVRRPRGDGPHTYLGRIDFQVKVSGHRVELGEIEAVLRQETGIDEVVVVGWPPIETGFAAVVAFVQGETVDAEHVRRRLAVTLPEHMVPREIRALPELPRNVNGKVDRHVLRALLEQEP